MTDELQALRERFRDQMPGQAVFDELLAKYERLLQAQTALEQRWMQTAPEALKTLRTKVQAVIDSPDLTPEIKAKLVTILKGGMPA